ncbi:MAG TPA: GNAT family N-acetyltransferase [Polyangiales bacterium]|nr:GNAT family N-acetyltransferase [Polyangiales bacterium]
MPAGFDREVASIAPRASSAVPEATDRSGTYRSSLPPQTLSQRFWGLDFSNGLPRTLSNDGVHGARGELSRVREFLEREFPTFTEEELGAQLDPRMADAKRAYLLKACDLIEMRHEDRTVGVIVGAPEDWSSYYVRIFAVSKDYQRRGLVRRFARESLFQPLIEHRVERVIADTSPVNLAMTNGFTEMRFYATGHQLTERWGALVRYTKFLDPEREAAFYRRFAASLPNRPRKEWTP